jgi:predicted DNA-binding protein
MRKDVPMAWYDIPKIKPHYLYDETGEVRGVLLKAKDFEKLVEKMEDFYDVAAVERVKKENKKFYSFEEIKKLIENKK